MTFQNTVIKLLNKLQDEYSELESIKPFDELTRDYIKENINNSDLIKLIGNLESNTRKLESTLSMAAMSTAQVIPGVNDDLYQFLNNVVRPRKVKLFVLYCATLEVDLYELFKDVTIEDKVGSTIKDIFETGIFYWDEVIQSGDDSNYNEEDIDDAYTIFNAQFFNPDRWLKNSRDLKPILMQGWDYYLPKTLGKRLQELYLSYVLENYMAAISLSRAILEYTLIHKLGEINVDIKDKEQSDRYLSLEKLVNLASKKYGVEKQELDYIRNWGNAVMHPEGTDKVSEYPARKNISLKCIKYLVKNIEILYRQER